MPEKTNPSEESFLPIFTETPIADCCGEDSSCCTVDRRNFVKMLGLGTMMAAGTAAPVVFAAPTPEEHKAAVEDCKNIFSKSDWTVLRYYPQSHIAHIAMPIGGVGTGCVSLGGRGDLRDWEIMNRAGKGFVPMRGEVGPFFCIYTETSQGKKSTLALEGPIAPFNYEGSHGTRVPNENLPRFRNACFSTAYPLGQVALSDDDFPVDVILRAYNPFIPADSERSGMPVVALTYKVINKSGARLKASICGTLPNFIGMDGWEVNRGWTGNWVPTGAKGNNNHLRQGEHVHGIFMDSEGIDPKSEQWGSIALSTPHQNITHRLDWIGDQWGSSFLDFWDDFSVDGRLEPREQTNKDMPVGSLAVSIELEPNASTDVEFFITWHFPNRITWTPAGGERSDEDIIGNYYTTKYADAWDAAEKFAVQRHELQEKTLQFVQAFCESDLPEVVKESALFNISTLRSQTCFRTPDGRFYGWEGLCDQKGCCHGSCTHVWNYEQALAFLFGDLALSMRDVEFAHATDDTGMMSFRVHLPLSRAHHFNKAAADGQMGCIMKLYRDWQLSGDDETLKHLWPKARKSIEFCWIPGGWDADKDGVMEGCQHNTMDVEYFGPNPQMGIYYLGALRAVQEMAQYLGEKDFAQTCKDLFENGSKWIDENLFNGEYYEHEIRIPQDASEIAKPLIIGMGSKDFTNPDFQLGSGCLVDQLIGQFLAHVCGLGYLTKPENVKKTHQAILKYNHRESMHDHFNNMRTFALGNEAALLMASYPKDRPHRPFSYFNEVMTGFEYTAAIGMLYEDQTDEGLSCIQDIRNRYDGLKRNPFNEAECGHHYARAMASWAALLALSGFQYSGVKKEMTFHPKSGKYFWSNGYAWGTCAIRNTDTHSDVALSVIYGEVPISTFVLRDYGIHRFGDNESVSVGSDIHFQVARNS